MNPLFLSRGHEGSVMTTGGPSETWHWVFPTPVGHTLHSLPRAVGKWLWDTSGHQGAASGEAVWRVTTQCHMGGGKACHICDMEAALGQGDVL